MSTLALDLPRAPSLPRSAIAVSIVIHVAALLLLPGLASKTVQDLPTLVATLRFLPASQSSASEPPTPAIPQAQVQHVSPTPRPSHKVEKAPTTTPITVPSEAPAAPASSAAPAVTAAVPARSDSAPATPAQSAPTSAAAPVPESTALDDYGRALSDLLARQQQYPRVAAMRGWEGEVRLRLRVARKGNLVAVQVVHSSGHEVLDQHAVQMVQGATLPSPPDAFGDREIQVVVPIHYKLQKST